VFDGDGDSDNDEEGGVQIAGKGMESGKGVIYKLIIYLFYNKHNKLPVPSLLPAHYPAST
jgi:hypothetical protein